MKTVFTPMTDHRGTAWHRSTVAKFAERVLHRILATDSGGSSKPSKWHHSFGRGIVSSSGIHQPGPHESAHLHVTGKARYVADEPGPVGTLFVLPVTSPVARGRLLSIDVSAAAASPGVHGIYQSKDVPGANLWGPIEHTEPLFAEDRVEYMGQVVAIVAAETEALAREAAQKVRIDVESEPPVLTIQDGIEAGDFLYCPHRIERGDVEAVFENVPHGRPLRIFSWSRSLLFRVPRPWLFQKRTGHFCAFQRSTPQRFSMLSLLHSISPTTVLSVKYPDLAVVLVAKKVRQVRMLHTRLWWR